MVDENHHFHVRAALQNTESPRQSTRQGYDEQVRPIRAIETQLTGTVV
jgi:hypothetical protein